MILLTQEDLKKSTNKFICEVVKTDFILSVPEDKISEPIKLLMKNLNRNLLINNQAYPETIHLNVQNYETSKIKLKEFLDKELG
ncbi:MAG: hypothetical protein LEGION0398_MBIBDBAK_00943 [Legionellaceae bacterium]